MEIEGYKDKHEYTNKNGITSIVYLMDCMDLLKQVPDKYFELAVVDPPYQNNDAIGLKDNVGIKKQATKRTTYKQFANIAPKAEYWELLKRVSKNSIVWGGNYYGLSGGAIVWDKNGTAFGEGEIAICTTHHSVRFYEFTWNGMIQGNMKNKENRIHPTQKPITLYEWLFKNYAKPNDKILDTHLGSGSSRIAADRANLPFVGCELDADYFYASVKRFNEYTSQLTIF